MFCRYQLGELAHIEADLAKRGVGIAGISVDEPSDSATLAKDLDVHYPLLSDPKLETIGAYGVAMQGRDIAVPAIFIVLRDGRVAWKKIGEDVNDRPSPADILKRVDEALAASKR